MNSIEKEILDLRENIFCIQKHKPSLELAASLLENYNYTFGHIRVHGSFLTHWCSVSVGSPMKGMSSVLTKLAANGFHQKEKGGTISPIQTGLNWEVYRGDVSIVITALVEGSTCEIVQVSTKETPVYAIKCE